MGMFDRTDDELGGVELEPSPALTGEAPDVPVDVAAAPAAAAMPAPAILPADAPMVGPQRPTVSAPVPPMLPDNHRTNLQKIMQMAILGVAAGLGPRRGNGIPQGIMLGQHNNDVQRQQDFQNQQAQFRDQVQAYQEQQQAQEFQQRQQQARDAKLQQNLQLIATELKGAKTKAEYDGLVERYGQLMGLTGESRITASWLRGTMPYRAPEAKQIAGAALTTFFNNPLTKEQLKKDPNAVANGSMYIDLMGTGTPQLVPIREAMKVAGMSVLADDKGQPIAMEPGAQGDALHIALANRIAQFKLDNRRAPQQGREMLDLLALAKKDAKPERDPKEVDQSKLDDADAIADAIVDGSQPPDLSRLYGQGAHVRAALARKKYNLVAAQQDWTAVQKFIATANGPQQLRMRQGVDNASHSLDVIDQLAQEWDGGRFPMLNRGRLAAAKSGALGADAQKLAQKLEMQIADVTAELGTVYLGGNSPTDHALQLAQQNLQSDWSLPTLRAAVALARTNLKIRQNSMLNIGPAGTGGQNRYAPVVPPADTPAAAPLVNPFRKP